VPFEAGIEHHLGGDQRRADGRGHGEGAGQQLERKRCPAQPAAGAVEVLFHAPGGHRHRRTMQAAAQEVGQVAFLGRIQHQADHHRRGEGADHPDPEIDELRSFDPHHSVSQHAPSKASLGTPRMPVLPLC
jgi:hypothetical protein